MKLFTLNLVVFLFFQSFDISAQNLDWAFRIGTGSIDTGIKTLTDSEGNVITVGNFTAQFAIDMDPGPGISNLNPSGDKEIFIQKVDANGNFIWAKMMAGYDDDGVSAAVMDASDNLVITGYVSENCDMDPGPGVNIFNLGQVQNTGFVSKIAPDGNLVWTRRLNSRCSAVTLDGNENVCLTGFYNSTTSIDFDPGSGTYLLPEGNASFVLKLDPAGDFLWARPVSSTYVHNHGIQADASGNLYMVGQSSCTVVYPSTTCNSYVTFDPNSTSYTYGNGLYDGYLYKLNAAGDFQWVKMIGGSGVDNLNAVEVTPDGNIVIIGEFSQTVNFGTLQLTSSGGKDAFAAMLNPDGDYIWVKKIGGTGEELSNGIAVSESGAVYFSGSFEGTSDMDPGQGVVNVTSNGLKDIFVVKLDVSGDLIWNIQYGGPHIDECTSVHSDHQGSFYITGSFRYDVDFDPRSGVYQLTSGGSPDIFVSKLVDLACAQAFLKVDSISDVTCTAPGFISVSFQNAVNPITYTWENFPAFTGDSMLTEEALVQQLTITDVNNCTRSTSFLINAPSMPDAFDLKANVVASSFRPGFDATISVDAFNDGCIPVTGDLKLVADTLLIINSTDPPASEISGDTMIWHFNDLSIASGHIVPILEVTTSTEAEIGQTINIDVFITPVTGDNDTTNNIKHYTFPVVNGYDPNDKKVFPAGECIPGFIASDQKLTYTIRFQNTGNSEAINIFVLDSLDAGLNLQTVHIVGKSHPVITEVLAGNVLKFRFDDIMLADSLSNEPESHGYIVFEVLPNAGLPEGTPIRNKTEIYFDYNDPITTNSVLNTISYTDHSSMTNVDIVTIDSYTMNGETYTESGTYVQTLQNILGCDSTVTLHLTLDYTGLDENSLNAVTISPNPTSDFISIGFNNPTDNKTLLLTDIHGKILIEKTNLTGNEYKLDLSGMQSGVYLLQTSSRSFRIVKH